MDHQGNEQGRYSQSTTSGKKKPGSPLGSNEMGAAWNKQLRFFYK